MVFSISMRMVLFLYVKFSSFPQASVSSSPTKQPTENEQMVNEMLHEDASAFAGRSDSASTAEEFQKKVRETMEKAFWDMVTNSMRGERPDYSQLINLVKEVRESLHDLAPKEWKEKILENIDLEILSQVLGPGSQDAQYLGQILPLILEFDIGGEFCPYLCSFNKCLVLR